MNDALNSLQMIPPSGLKIKDKKGRVLITISPNGKFAIARFPDMSEKMKTKVLDICRSVLQDNTNLDDDIEKILKFICFESDEDEFCS